jgi:hypothetical protein
MNGIIQIEYSTFPRSNPKYQEITTTDFDDLDFLSHDNIFEKPIWTFFPV